MALVFVMTTLVTRFVIECCGGGLLVGGLAAADPSFDPSDASSIPPGGLALVTLIMLAVLGGVAVAFAWGSGHTRRTLGLRRGSLWVYPLAVMGGLTVGLSSGDLGSWLQEIVPDILQFGQLDAIGEGLTGGSWLGRGLMLIAVCLGAPLFEELVFRGTLWGLLERALPGWAVLLVTSSLFAVYHIDPIHVILVFPVALLLGWTRLTSGSLFPCILLHAVNNGLAAVAVFTLDADLVTPIWLAAACALMTLFTALLMWLGRYREAVRPSSRTQTR